MQKAHSPAALCHSDTLIKHSQILIYNICAVHQWTAADAVEGPSETDWWWGGCVLITSLNNNLWIYGVSWFLANTFS